MTWKHIEDETLSSLRFATRAKSAQSQVVQQRYSQLLALPELSRCGTLRRHLGKPCASLDRDEWESVDFQGELHLLAGTASRPGWKTAQAAAGFLGSSATSFSQDARFCDPVRLLRAQTVGLGEVLHAGSVQFFLGGRPHSHVHACSRRCPECTQRVAGGSRSHHEQDADLRCTSREDLQLVSSFRISNFPTLA